MNKFLITFAMTWAIAKSQTNVRPMEPSAQPAPERNMARHNEAARPLLGYLTDPTNHLRSIVGSARNPQWGEPITLPEETVGVFLPPRGEFVLLSSKSGLNFARLSRGQVYPGIRIPNANALPDRVAFSPTGKTAALFSLSESRFEVLNCVSAVPQLLWRVSVPNAAGLLSFTVSDDGDLLVATFANQSPAFSWRGAAWRSLLTSYRLDAFAFIPLSHDLVVSDLSRRSIALLPEAERPAIPMRVLAADVLAADLLATDRQGAKLLAAESGTANFWSIDLVSGEMTQLPVKGSLDSLVVLRDGQTVLVSQKDAPIVVLLNKTQSSAINISQ